jgi:hypothetical protein
MAVEFVSLLLKKEPTWRIFENRAPRKVFCLVTGDQENIAIRSFKICIRQMLLHAQNKHDKMGSAYSTNGRDEKCVLVGKPESGNLLKEVGAGGRKI